MRGILKLKSELHFGKHNGKTVEEVMLADVGWLCWLRSEELKSGKNAFDTEVNELLDAVLRDDKNLHRRFGSSIGKWQEVGNPIPTVIATPEPVSVVLRESAYADGWGAW